MEVLMLPVPPWDTAEQAARIYRAAEAVWQKAAVPYRTGRAWQLRQSLDILESLTDASKRRQTEWIVEHTAIITS